MLKPYIIFVDDHPQWGIYLTNIGYNIERLTNGRVGFRAIVGVNLEAALDLVLDLAKKINSEEGFVAGIAIDVVDQRAKDTKGGEKLLAQLRKITGFRKGETRVALVTTSGNFDNVDGDQADCVIFRHKEQSPKDAAKRLISLFELEKHLHSP